MTPSDSQPTGTASAPAFDEGSKSAELGVEDVKNIITQAQAGATDPVSVALQIFDNLGVNITVSGDTLRQALTDSGVATDGPMAALLAAAASIAKTGSQVTVTSTKETQTQISGNAVKFSPVVAFNAGVDGGFPTMSNIQGAAVHKLFWIGVTQIQLRESQGQKSLHVETSAGARDFPLAQG
jgi:hypothetical protein